MFGAEFDSDPSASEKRKKKKNRINRQINKYTTMKVLHTKMQTKNLAWTHVTERGTTTEFQAIFQTIDEIKQQMILCHHYDH